MKKYNCCKLESKIIKKTRRQTDISGSVLLKCIDSICFSVFLASSPVWARPGVVPGAYLKYKMCIPEHKMETCEQVSCGNTIGQFLKCNSMTLCYSDHQTIVLLCSGVHTTTQRAYMFNVPGRIEICSSPFKFCIFSI